ncbi:MAG: threonine synthase [Pseudohongiellaceae bacterium]|jgi:threonine synthase
MAAAEAPMASALVCSGCGWRAGPDTAEPFRCQEQQPGDDVDHVLVRELSGPSPDWPSLPRGSEAGSLQPFVHFRRFLHSWRTAISAGMSDEEWCDIVLRIDEVLAQVDGSGFRFTPYGRAPELSNALGFSSQGGVFIKNETGNVSGSHKARHLMGLAIWFAVTERVAYGEARLEAALAIASCGNAALAAAVVARAVQRPLQVFVPEDADASVMDKLQFLEAQVLTCERREGDPPGDPCLHRFHEAVAGGALPFSCQGSENGLVVEGGSTLAWELICQHQAAGRAALDRLFVQVGGGALASSLGQGFTDAQRAGGLLRSPSVFAVQAVGAAPFYRAWRRFVGEGDEGAGSQGLAAADGLKAAARHRSQYMWPLETQPASAAGGILDDETYDWLGVLRAVTESGGQAVVASEEHIARAHRLAHEHTTIDVCITGAAGLAGLLACLEAGAVAPDESVALLFTGHKR